MLGPQIKTWVTLALLWNLACSHTSSSESKGSQNCGYLFGVLCEGIQGLYGALKGLHRGFVRNTWFRASQNYGYHFGCPCNEDFW